MKPEPKTLERAASLSSKSSWVRLHAAGLVAFLVGLTALSVTALVHFGGEGELTKIPDIRLTIPFLVTAVISAVTAFVRREGAYALPVAGLALACSAVVLGWALVLAAVAGVALLTILILSEMM